MIAPPQEIIVPELTTAQRLAAYRDELLNAGFTPAQTWELLTRIAPDKYDHIKIKNDLEGGTHA